MFEKDFGYNADVDDGFKEPKDGRKQATALNDRCGANSVQGDVTDSRNNNQDTGNGYRSRHVECFAPPAIFSLHVRLLFLGYSALARFRSGPLCPTL